MTAKISRLYNNYPDARQAASDLEAAGVDSGDISIIASNADDWYSKGDKVKHVDVHHDKDRDGVDDRVEGARTGAAVGGAAAGAAGLAAGLGLLAIPGIGPVVAMGWAASTLAGLVSGGVVGGAVGALVESGVAKDDADVYAEAIRRGGALVVARVADKDGARYQDILNRSAVDVNARAAVYRGTGWTGFNPDAPAFTPDEVARERTLYR
jgi:hypothetical protein